MTLVANGIYSGKENHDIASEKNTRLVNTNLSEKTVDDILADFEFSESETKGQSPSGHKPNFYGYTGGKSQQFHISLNKDWYRAELHKRVSSVTVFIKVYEWAKQQNFMGTEEFRNLFRIRNSVESVPSMLSADRMPVRGLLR